MAYQSKKPKRTGRSFRPHRSLQFLYIFCPRPTSFEKKNMSAAILANDATACVATSKIFLFLVPFFREGVTATPILALNFL